METLKQRILDRYGLENLDEFIAALGISMEDLVDALEVQIHEAIAKEMLDV
jgi:hypothetical protein